MNEPIATDEADNDIAYSVTHNPNVVPVTDEATDAPAESGATSAGAAAPSVGDQIKGAVTDAVTVEPIGGEVVDDGSDEAVDEVDMAALDETLEYIRPALQADGGDLILLGVKGGTVNLQLVGACGGCPMSTMTLKQGIERIIFDRVPGATEVVAI